MPASKGLGTTIARGAQNIGVLVSISSPELSADTIETTTLDVSDGHRTFMQGLRDGGEVSISGYFDNIDVGQTALKTAFDNGTLDAYTITFPSAIGATWTFSGIVTKFKTGDATLEDPLGFEVTLKISGKPNLGTSASGGLTALVLSGTSPVLSPSFDNGKFVYSHTFTTTTSITVTATAASHTLKLYVDNFYVQDLTSGSASSAITGYTAGSSKKIEIVAYEAGKSPKTYTISSVRTT